MEDNKAPKPQRRIVLPERKTRVDLQMSVEDVSVDTTLNDLMQTISMEAAKYRTKVARGQSLELKEARIVQGFVKALVDIKREMREQARAADLADLSEEELFALAKKALKASDSSIIEQRNADSEQEEGEEDDEQES